MAEKETTKAPETVQFMDKECVVTTHSDGTERIQMRKGDYESILDGFGITKEVRAKQREVDDVITENAAKFLEKRLHKINKGKKEDSEGFIKKSELALGGGNTAMKFSMMPVKRHTSVDMKTGEKRETVSCGVFKVTKCYQFAQKMREEGGLLDQIAESFAKDFGAKK